MHLYEPNQFFECPHCGHTQEDPAGEYVIPGRVGKASIAAPSQCDDCDHEFTAEKLEDGRIRVEAV